jgi:hypothetical protein
MRALVVRVKDRKLTGISRRAQREQRDAGVGRVGVSRGREERHSRGIVESV